MNTQIEIETFGNVVGFPNYQVSTFGNVKNVKTGRILKPSIGSDGYYIVKLYNDDVKVTKRIHKLIALTFLENPDDKKCVDHVDRNSKNNHISNLRWATYVENSQNASIKSSNTSGIAGISWYKKTNKWHARIQVNGVQKHLGYFENKDDAITARTNAEILYFGDFRAVNQVV